MKKIIVMGVAVLSGIFSGSLCAEQLKFSEIVDNKGVLHAEVVHEVMVCGTSDKLYNDDLLNPAHPYWAPYVELKTVAQFTRKKKFEAPTMEQAFQDFVIKIDSKEVHYSSVAHEVKRGSEVIHTFQFPDMEKNKLHCSTYKLMRFKKLVTP